jgi:hypothetical protein
MNYTQISFLKVLRTYTFTQAFLDFAIALLTIITFPFMIFCLVIRSIFYKRMDRGGE